MWVSYKAPEHQRNVKRFRGGLVFKAHKWLYDSTLGLRVIKKRKKSTLAEAAARTMIKSGSNGG